MTKLSTVINKFLLTTLALTTTIITSIPQEIKAQNNPGLTIFSGVERDNILNYRLDFGGNAGGWDRYRLRVPGKKITEGVAKFFISYPDYFDGKWNTEKFHTLHYLDSTSYGTMGPTIKAKNKIRRSHQSDR